MNVTFSQATPFPPLPISAAGMCTSLGGLVAGCAAARAGIQRISELPPQPGEAVSNEGSPELLGENPREEGGLKAGEGEGPTHEGGLEPAQDGAPEDELSEEEEDDEEESAFFGHRVRDLPEDADGADRLALLVTRALEDLFSGLSDPPTELGRYAFILCLPSGYLEWAHSAMRVEAPDAFSTGVFLDPGEEPRLEAVKESLLPKIFSPFPELPQPVWTGLVLEDQAGFSEGVTRAAALLAQRRVDSCLLGGVDSRVGAGELQTLQDLGLAMTSDFPAGFIPGEGAGFLHLRPPDWTGESLAMLESAAQAAEPCHRLSESPPVGDALVQAAQSALQNAAAADTGILALAPVNGSPWISNEWGYLITRVRTLGEAEHRFPAGEFGELGAATGPVAACRVIRGFARGDLKQDHAIVILSSESGRKGAVVLRRPTPLGGRT